MLIQNATLVTWNQPNEILPGHALYIEDGRIAALGPGAELETRYPQADVLDARGQLLLPGLICAHTHFYGAFSRGMAIPGNAPANFPEILQKLWWPLDRSLTEDDVRYSALLCLVDAIRHGTTTLVDHHASPNAIDDSLDVIAEAVQQAGVRAALCYEVTDRDGPQKFRAGVDENVRFIRRARAEPHPLLAATFGLHASLTLSARSLDACRAALPPGAGFHVHAGESRADEEDSIAKSGLRVVGRLARHGILGPRSILAHGVHFSDEEIHILSESGSWLTHQPRSNMNNAVGIAPVEKMLAAGVKVCLGNDGFSNAMWEEWKAAYLVHKLGQGDPRAMNGATVTGMGIYNNAALASQLFGRQVGVLAVGAAADLILVDYHAPTPLGVGNLPWHILFGFRETMVTTTIVHGKVLMKDRQLLTLDEAAIAARAQELAAQVWKRYEEKF